MSAWRLAGLVAWRELRERSRSKEMIVSTVLSLAILAVVVVAGAGFGGDEPSFEVGTVGERPAEVAAVARDLAGDRVTLDVTDVDDAAAARRQVQDGDLDAALVDGTIAVGEDLDDQLASLLQAAHREVALGAVLDDAGATPEQIAAAAPEPLRTDALDPDRGQDERRGVAFIGVLLLYAQLFGFGYWVASGIVEEKSSRVVEVLLAKAGARPLLAGKITGIGLLGLAQLVLFAAVGLGLVVGTGAVDIPAGTTGVIAALIGWFVAGYALYAGLFAMSGAIASRSEELQSTTSPLTIVVMASFFAAIFAGQDPEGTMAQVATFVPVSAPLVVPIRSAVGAISGAEMALALGIVVLTTVAVVRLAARVYAGGALSTRRQIKVREAMTRAEER